MNKIIFSCLCLVFFSMPGLAQVGVPGGAVSIMLPSTHVRFPVKNHGERAVIVTVDLAPRSDVYTKSSDGFVVLHPKNFRVEPGAVQLVSAVWRGSSQRSHYYYVRVNAVSETELTRDRDNKVNTKAITAKVGQAFPLNIIAPESSPKMKLSVQEGSVFLDNIGTRGDYVDQVRLAGGRIANIGRFLVPGEKALLAGVSPNESVVSVKLRQAGWVEVGR